MNNSDQVILTFGQLKKLVKESRKKLFEAKKEFTYVYLSEIFHKQPANIPQRSLRRVFKQFDSESEKLDESVREWMKEMVTLPKNEWVTPKDMNMFVGVVWDKDGAGRGYGISPALKFKDYDAAENYAYLLSDYGNWRKETGWGYTRNWIGRSYP